MANIDRNDPSRRAGDVQPQKNQDNQDENPQQGVQWDNYQTRTLSSEGEPELTEKDLLSADEAQKQKGGGVGNG